MQNRRAANAQLSPHGSPPRSQCLADANQVMLLSKPQRNLDALLLRARALARHNEFGAAYNDLNTAHKVAGKGNEGEAHDVLLAEAEVHQLHGSMQHAEDQLKQVHGQAPEVHPRGHLALCVCPATR